jgi:RNA polymerase sigma-70 factor, ECF subfamily
VHRSMPAWVAGMTEATEVQFERLFETHRGALARLAAAYARTAADRDDLLQDIAISLWRALPRFRGDCSERTFLFRVAQNRAIAYVARRGRIELPEDAMLDLADPKADPEEALLEKRRDRQLTDAIRELPLIYREVLTLALEGMSYGEIAEITGISESNVGARLTRAKQKLRQTVKGEKA